MSNSLSGNTSKRKRTSWRPFEEARKYVHGLKLRDREDMGLNIVSLEKNLKIYLLVHLRLTNMNGKVGETGLVHILLQSK